MTKTKRRTPKKVYEAVAERSEGICEWEGCNALAEQMAHLKHRGMGGTTDPLVHSVDNIRNFCKYHHDLYDGRITGSTAGE